MEIKCLSEDFDYFMGSSAIGRINLWTLPEDDFYIIREFAHECMKKAYKLGRASAFEPRLVEAPVPATIFEELEKLEKNQDGHK